MAVQVSVGKMQVFHSDVVVIARAIVSDINVAVTVDDVAHLALVGVIDTPFARPAELKE